MESLDLRVLQDALHWREAGHAVRLITVVDTWGSAPRPPGALLAICDDARISGSVSGGCVEDDLIAKAKADIHDEILNKTPIAHQSPRLLIYGVTQEEAYRFGLPCGGTLRLLQEDIYDVTWIKEILQRCHAHQFIARTIELNSGTISLRTAERSEQLQFDGKSLTSFFGPRWRLLMIGAGQLSQILARMALSLDFEVSICDPREEYTVSLASATHGEFQLLNCMPDDFIQTAKVDAHTAIVALSHDPKLDDLALIDALVSPAFYVGALGSLRNQAARKQRLSEHFEITAEQLTRLHGPVGLDIGARTPAEIAISILAEIIMRKNADFIQARNVRNAHTERGNPTCDA